MKTIEIHIEGTSPLMQHRMSDETMFGLLGAKSSKKKSKVEETPRQIAEQHVYRHEGQLAIPLEYFRGAFIGASSEYKLSNSSRKSLKTIAGGVFRPTAETVPIIDPETEKPVKDFEVDVRRATNHRMGAVAVCRPRFDKWSCKFEVVIDDELIPIETAEHILSDAGRRIGVGSFRVSKGGFFGQFRISKFSVS